MTVVLKALQYYYLSGPHPASQTAGRARPSPSVRTTFYEYQMITAPGIL